MAEIITSLTASGTYLFTLMGNVVEFIVGQPLILLFIGFSVVGAAISQVTRLLRG